MNYREWIRANVDGRTNGYGKCREICEAMAVEFSQLEVRKGIFHSIAWGPRTHWWLRERGGPSMLVDPTARQHPDGVHFPTGERYRDLTDVTEEAAIAEGTIPVGKCPNCGGLIYAPDEHGGVCSTRCGEEYAAYLNGGGL